MLEGPNFKKTQESKIGFPQDSKNKEKTNKTHAQGEDQRQSHRVGRNRGAAASRSCSSRGCTRALRNVFVMWYMEAMGAVHAPRLNRTGRSCVPSLRRAGTETDRCFFCSCAETKGPPRYRVLKVATCAQRKGQPCTKEGTEVRIPNRGSHVFIILFFDTVRNLFWGVPPPTPATKNATVKVTPRTPLKF